MDDKFNKSAKRAILKFVTLAVFFVSTPINAQITPFDLIQGYRIASVAPSDVCLATAKVTSNTERDMSVTFYRTAEGQRWQVVGYLAESDHSEPTDTLEILFDDKSQLMREVEFRDGDFILPFEQLAEVQAFESSIKTSKTLTLALRDDKLDLPLVNLRAALNGLHRCLKETS